MIRSAALSFGYNEQQRFQFPDIQADSSRPLLILGGSGVGKTTLLHLLAGILRPDTGQVFVGEKELFGLSTRALDRYRGRHIGLVFQKSHFVASLSVKDNLLLAQYLAGERKNIDLIEEILGRLNLRHKLDQKTYRLSIGEQQRVAIARAILNDPDVILADEPTSALDDANAEEVISLLEEAAKAANAALVIVTHDNRLKDRISNRVELH